MLRGILAVGTNTPAFAVLMASIMHALPSLPVDATPAAQIPVLFRADAAVCEAGSHPAWTPAFLHMAAELRLLGLAGLVMITALIEYATQWTAAYLTVPVALTVGIGIAHEVAVVSECCSAAALVRQLSRHAAAGRTGPARRHRVLPEEGGGAAAVEGRTGELQDAVHAAHAAHSPHWSPAHLLQQCALVRGWHVAASAGNLCNMAYFVLLAVEFKVDSVAKRVSIHAEDAFDSPGHTIAPRLLLGAGAALLWVSLLQYLEHFPKYYSFILTLKRAMPRLTRVRAPATPRCPAPCFTRVLLAVSRQRCSAVRGMGPVRLDHVRRVCTALGQPQHDVHHAVRVCERGRHAGDLFAHAHPGEQLHDGGVADLPVHLRVPVHVRGAERVRGHQRRGVLRVAALRRHRRARRAAAAHHAALRARRGAGARQGEAAHRETKSGVRQGAVSAVLPSIRSVCNVLNAKLFPRLLAGPGARVAHAQSSEALGIGKGAHEATC